MTVQIFYLDVRVRLLLDFAKNRAITCTGSVGAEGIMMEEYFLAFPGTKAKPSKIAITVKFQLHDL